MEIPGAALVQSLAEAVDENLDRFGSRRIVQRHHFVPGLPEA